MFTYKTIKQTAITQVSTISSLGVKTINHNYQLSKKIFLSLQIHIWLCWSFKNNKNNNKNNNNKNNNKTHMWSNQASTKEEVVA